MSRLTRMLVRATAAATLGMALATAPGTAEASPVVRVSPASCPLDPGVYGIIDSSGQLVGILIVYPDCRMEVFRKQVT